MRKIPEDAFALYVSMGADRSYNAVAQHYNVSKRAIVKTAHREGWASRLAAIEEVARKRCDEKLAEGVAETRERHVKLLRAMASRAARGLQEFPLTDGMQAIRAAEAVIKLERIVMGEPAERTELTIAQITKQELERYVVRDDEPDDEPGDDEVW